MQKKKNSFDDYISSIVAVSRKTESRMADQMSTYRVASNQMSPSDVRKPWKVIIIFGTKKLKFI